MKLNGKLSKSEKTRRSPDDTIVKNSVEVRMSNGRGEEQNAAVRG